MDYELQSRFNKFWDEWEAQKKNMLSELRSTVMDKAYSSIHEIEKNTTAECDEKFEATKTTLKGIESMQQDLSQSFDLWREEVNTLVNTLKQEEAALARSVETTMQSLQRERESIEKNQGQELIQLHKNVMKILSEASERISEKYDHGMATKLT
ncbi:hypothetical protein XU18_2555 [Perkinsela sp. CCAP 1560/4]|nr:glutathione-S-transferase/glutaredoxin [Perkinsela sp. CCAP 1560/4]KNH06654.1 hypothetical protein XU18_2555 [Perkinsela sp. CCAP 1560/4]|eukprot:KNH04649.1 glutathione-S-transferase/glutaredoxin [Perkinsela sp. CCAP 1560/4]